MKENETSSINAWLGWLRISLLVLTLGVAGFWISSYFIGIQRYQSNWSTSKSAASEEARWFVSNHGSMGLAWRLQEGEFGSPVPSDMSELKIFDSSPSALNNVHPEGFSAWHWIHYMPTDTKIMGAMHTGYGHLYVPYWMPFLASGLLAYLISVCIKRRAKS